MSQVFGAFRAELLRLTQPRRRLLVPLAAVLGAGYTWAFGAAAASGLLGSPTGFYIAAGASGGVVLTCALVGALLSASGVGGDLASGIARTALCRPVSRASWIAGRILALCLTVTALYLSAELGALIAGAARYGLHGAADGTYEIATAGFLAAQLGTSVALSALALCAFVALGALAGVLAGRTGSAVIGVALAGAALTAVGRWPRIEQLLPLSHLTSALDRAAQLSQGLAAEHAGDGALKTLAVCLIWILGATLAAVVALDRRDILS